MSAAEFLSILELGIIYGIVALGIYLSFRTIDFPDLTCDGSFVVGAAASSILIKTGYNPWFALLAAIVAGGIAGFVTGILNTRFKITDLLSGILVAFMLYSINLKVMGGLPNIGLSNEATIFNDYNVLAVLVSIAVALWVLTSYVLSTNWGLAVRSIGRNKRLAAKDGVRVAQLTVIALIASNSLIALGGALFSQHQGFADVSQGIGTLIIGLAAVMIGERLLPSLTTWQKVLACFVGSIIYRLFISVALHSELIGLESQDLNLITGVMVIAVMLLPIVKRRTDVRT